MATTRSKSSPSCTILLPKQEERSSKPPKTRACARDAAFVQNRSVKEEPVTRVKRKFSSWPAQKSAVKKEILEETDSSHNDEDVAAELDNDDHDLDYKDDSEMEKEDETHRRKRHFQTESPCVVAAPSHYESLRLQRIAENKARMAALGMDKQVASIASFFRAAKHKKAWTKSPSMPLELRRRSERLKTNSPSPGFYSPLFSNGYDSEIIETPKLQLVFKNRMCRNYQAEENVRPGNAPLPKNCPADLQISPLISALRCKSKERGTLYDAVVGICCHFCRQKKLCGEEDCERCGQRDVTKACLGKSDCSKCHSSTGVFCRACLKIRYGEDLEHVRERVDWLCPHCSEEQGLNPYWICNSSICLSRKKIPPTGIAIYKAKELGFESVAHYLEAHFKKHPLLLRLPTV